MDKVGWAENDWYDQKDVWALEGFFAFIFLSLFF